MDLDLGASAGAVLAADLVATPRARWWTNAGLLVSVVLGALAHGDWPGGPTVRAFLVVTRQDTGVELLRLRTDTDDAALLEHVRRQFDELTVGEFFDRWGIDASGAPSGEAADPE